MSICIRCSFYSHLQYAFLCSRIIEESVEKSLDLTQRALSIECAGSLRVTNIRSGPELLCMDQNARSLALYQLTELNGGRQSMSETGQKKPVKTKNMHEQEQFSNAPEALEQNRADASEDLNAQVNMGKACRNSEASDAGEVRGKLKHLKNKLGTERPVNWTHFPDIGLYKDQVVSYMYRQLINFEEGGQLTSAMVNNYIKDGLLPRADGKKYSREHLAGLTEICLLKQVLSVKDAGFLLKQGLRDDDQEGFYTGFVSILDDALTKTAGLIDSQWDIEELSDMALRFAVSSYCEKIACERLVEIIRGIAAADEQKKSEKKLEKKDHRIEKKE